MKGYALFFTAIISILIVEPFFYGLKVNAVFATYRADMVETSSSCKKTCSKSTEKEDKEDCEGSFCNPLLGCPAGNFYVHSYSYIRFTTITGTKQEIVIANDNRISRQLTECWHPPEII